jgi:hypothetical protein
LYRSLLFLLSLLFWVWDFDKEEKWLNEMAAKGLSLVSVGFYKYEFVRTPVRWCRHSAGHGALIPALWCTLSAEDGAPVPFSMVHGGQRRWCTAAMLGLSL